MTDTIPISFHLIPLTIICLVAHQSLHLRHHTGMHAKLVHNFLNANFLLGDGIEDIDIVIDQLTHVLVRTDNGHPAAKLLSVSSIRRNEIVCLVALLHDHGTSEYLGRLLCKRKLYLEIRICRGSVGLVVLTDVGAESLSTMVEKDAYFFFAHTKRERERERELSERLLSQHHCSVVIVVVMFIPM